MIIVIMIILFSSLYSPCNGLTTNIVTGMEGEIEIEPNQERGVRRAKYTCSGRYVEHFWADVRHGRCEVGE
jgi:hypothetical protein